MDKLYRSIREFCERRTHEFDQIDETRKERLQLFANYLKGKIEKGESAKVIIICTHNSRRSHMGQVWSAIAAHYYGIEDFASFSGGTEGTAFFESAVKALKSQGIRIEKTDEGDNPRYTMKWSTAMQPYIAWSTRFDEEPNPKEGFAAIMVCTSADEACPFVPGAEFRLALPYDDPKAFDGTPLAKAKYKERSRDIAREMLWVFSQVTK